MKLLLTILLLLTPISLQATTTTPEEISMQQICDELLIELADAIDNGLLTEDEGSGIHSRCEILI